MAAKVIEKIEAKKHEMLEKEINKLKFQYDVAQDWYRDTGYDKYFKKMERIEKELIEIEKYRDKDKLLEEEKEILINKKHETQEFVTKIKNKLFYIIADFPDCADIRNLKEYLDTIEG